MTCHVLGISALYHDAAAALVSDGEIVAAAQEERFSRRKHDPSLPLGAINDCLEQAFLDASELAAVVFYEDLALAFDRALKSLLQCAPASLPQWLRAAPSLLGGKPLVGAALRALLGPDIRLLTVPHHFAHAASAFYPSPYEEAAILVMDGVGEWASTSIGRGRGKRVELLRQINYPHSLGLLYSAFTAFCGFMVNSGEYKLMGLAPYGRPVYAGVIRERLIDLRPDGSFRLHSEYFGYLGGSCMTNARFHALFGGPPRAAEARITRREMDLAASIQLVLEEAVLALAAQARALTGLRRLVLAGGVALNCVANGKLLRSGLFDEVWIQPAAGDAGGALGAALLATHGYFELPRHPPVDGRDAQRGSMLGPAYASAEVRAFLDRAGLPYEHIDDAATLARRIAAALAAGQVVGLLSGRMEFGPRALGARSILGDPRSAQMQSRMNLKIKYRESFRPFAPVVLAERAADWFELDRDSPYMLLVAPVCGASSAALAEGEDDMLQLLARKRSALPAITHVDGSARVQTLRREQHPLLHGVLCEFERLSGCPVLVNTSFNVRGEPIVCSPRDAYRCFMRTGMELLVLEDCVLQRAAQPPWVEDEDWRQIHALD